jgi:RNA polymerase primary sigma factor
VASQVCLRQNKAAGADTSLGGEAEQTADLLGADGYLGIYFHEIGEAPLLTREEEVTLAARMEAARAAATLLCNDETSPEEQAELRDRIQAGKDARERFIASNTRLVISIARRYQGLGVPLIDLVQEGNLGLMRAVAKFDYHRGLRFSTYATWWIRQAISRAICTQARTIRLPVYMIERVRRMIRTQAELAQTLGRPPSQQELANALGLPPKKLVRLQAAASAPLSLDSSFDEDDKPLEETLYEGDVEDPQVPAEASEVHEEVELLLAILDEREAEMLRLRFGLEDGKVYTLEELATRFEVTRERVRQIQKHALEALRAPAEALFLGDETASIPRGRTAQPSPARPAAVCLSKPDAGPTEQAQGKEPTPVLSQR